jgi:adenylate cyclase
MATEIERKFLVRDDSWHAGVTATLDFRQGYLHSNPSIAVRVRSAGNEAFLTIKGAAEGISRREFEYAIPVADAEQMLEHLCRRPLIEKRRHLVPIGAHTWEIDVFYGANAGLVVAEIELGHPDEDFERPGWLGEEVSHDPRYYNARLNEHPFSQW